MIKGHLHQQRSNLRSTKSSITREVQNAAANQATGPCWQRDPAGVGPMENPINGPSNDDFTPAPMEGNGSQEEATVVFVDIEQVTGKTYSDQTSATGSNYVLIFYDYDSNSIHAEPIKNRTAAKLKRAYSTIAELLKSCGLHPKLQILDNEASKLLVDYITGQGINYQLAPPHVHRRNAAERAISTYKDPFITTHWSCGTNSFSKVLLHSIFCGDRASTRICRHMHRSLEHLISTRRPLPHLVPEYWSTRSRSSGSHGTRG
jgi:hypothetical protein